MIYFDGSSVWNAETEVPAFRKVFVECLSPHQRLLRVGFSEWQRQGNAVPLQMDTFYEKQVVFKHCAVLLHQ